MNLSTLERFTPRWWRAVRSGSKVKPEEPEQVPEHPAPEHTSRDPWPSGFTIPWAVTRMTRTAQAHGWAVGRTYARGTRMQATGKPGPLVESVALRMLHPETRCRAVLVYEIPAGAGAKGWSTCLVWGPNLPPFAEANVTEVREYLAARGRVHPSWVAAIRERVASAEAKRKAAPKRSARAREVGG
ncbi:MAG TPA: hypothetical protein VFU47_12555 [Armatimonadota bacterium]|nr:hypothetical protein [Armatimonadota bacterium]